MSDLPNRVQGVLLLLDQRTWWTPAPETGDGKRLRLGVRPGEAQFRTVQCSDCGGTGTRHRGKWTCQTCAGKGRYDVDDYTGARVVASLEDSAGDVPMAEVLSRVKDARCSVCADGKDKLRCDHCYGTGREPGLIGGRADLTGGMRARRREATGDKGLDDLGRIEDVLAHPAQAALTVALGRLEGENPAARALVRYVYELQLEKPQTLRAEAKVILAWSIGWLAAWMPAEFLAPREILRDLDRPRLNLPPEVLAAWRHRRSQLEPGVAKVTASGRGRHGNSADQKRRDKEIRELWAGGGYSRAALAQRYGLSYRRVADILKKEAA